MPIKAPTLEQPGIKLTRGLILLFAFCCGAIVANLYYAQPIAALIAPDVKVSSTAASLIVSLSQIGYAFGLFFLVPLGDLLEQKIDDCYGIGVDRKPRRLRAGS
jgi:MFS family permease